MKEAIQSKQENARKFRRISHIQTSYNRCNSLEKAGFVSELSPVLRGYMKTNILVDCVWDGQNIISPIQEACSKYTHRWEFTNT